MVGYIKKIEQIKFGLMSPEDIRKMSVVTVEYPDTYGDDGFPIQKGLMDPRLGIINPSLVCQTCGFKGGDCPGHFGSIELAKPVIHVGFGDVIHKILRSTCNECGRILLNDDQIEYYRNKINDALENKKSINSILKEVLKVAKRELITMPEEDEEVDLKHCCPHCGAPQEAIILDKPVTIRQGDYKLTPSEVRERLQKITDDDAFVLGINSDVVRPEWLVLTVLPVPPVTVRPSITLDTGERSEDDLTHKLVDILRINQRMLENMEAGAPQLIVEDLWELLQYHVTTYFDNEASGVPPARHRSGRPLKTLTQRLKGKEGRFRSNLSGKSVNFSARTVISPDPNISINEVGVPEMIAKEVTVPVHVNDWNIDEIKQYIINGPDVYPGANYIINGNTKRRIDDGTKKFILDNIEPGHIVERHLKDGDLVLLNRQPSLHRMSIMAHEVKVMPYKTFRINPCVCPPYNADFDGDEMNMHIFQTVESRAEAKSLMRVQEQILSPRFGGPIIGAVHDHISGAFLLTREGSEFTEEEALQFIRKSHIKIPKFEKNHWILKYNPKFNEDTFIYKKKGEKWTGKELFSLLLPNDMNLEFPAEISNGKNQILVETFDETNGNISKKIGFGGLAHPTDGYVVIKNGILTQGVIDESAFGLFCGKILDKIVKEYGSESAKEFLNKSTALAICGIMKTGITTSLNDEEIPQEVQDKIDDHLSSMMREVDFIIKSYEEGLLLPLPGRSLEDTLEKRIMQIMSQAREMSGKIALNYTLNESDNSLFTTLGNNSAVMAKTGARSSLLNLTQITACVGQQAIRGERIGRGYIGRTLPHFKKGDSGAKAKGFISSSYKSGLDPIEFFFHAMAGRDGLVDTAIRTAQSGYMQRRLVNALLDLTVDSNGVVKNNQGKVIQFMYGDDGVDPAKSDFGKVADLNRIIDEIRQVPFHKNDTHIESKILTPKEIKKLRIRLDYLENRKKFVLKEFKEFMGQVRLELKNIGEKYLDDESNQILTDCKYNYNKLIMVTAYPNDIESLDRLSNLIKSQQDFLNNSKKNWSKKKSEIFRIKFQEYENTISEYDNLFELVSKILNNKKEDFLKLYSQNEELLNNTKNLSDLIEKNFLINDLNIIKNNINNLLNSLDNLRNDINDIHMKYPFEHEKNNIDIQINKLKQIIEELNKFNSSILSNEIKNKEKDYNDFLDYENKLNNSKNSQDLIIQLKNSLKNPFLSIKLPGVNLEALEKEITKDIIEGKISGTDVNFEEIIISYHENNLNNPLDIDENEFNMLISDMDLSSYNESIVETCIINVKKGFESNEISREHVKIMLSRCISKKEKEYSQLKELNQIKNNPDVPKIKIHLTHEQQDEIYGSAEEKIRSKHGLKDNVLSYVQKKMEMQIGKNQTEAKLLFFSFNNIELRGNELFSFRKEIDYLISENIIKVDIIDEEFVSKTVSEFIRFGKIQMR